ncbi:FHA domain-containing protein [Streptomyces bobili]|uniref:FHA domain-containing protein n=1 Tax=Streptomyces bobili TaxID=67280 RepID=UPI000A3D4F0F|nr:FHA domain-containing protein [Streptomyces bobili]
MVRDEWERPPRHVDKSLAEGVDLDDEQEEEEGEETPRRPDDGSNGSDRPEPEDDGSDGSDEPEPEPPPWPTAPPEPVAPPSRAHSCWSCAADVPSGASACPECQESARHLRLISTRPQVDLRHGSCGPLNLGRHPTWAAPDVAAALDGEQGVSRRHASVEMTPDGGLWLTEHPTGTLNGTFVNGERVPPGERVPVTDGDTVRLGRHCAFTLLVVEPP